MYRIPFCQLSVSVPEISVNCLWLNMTARGLDHVAEYILSFLDTKSLCAAEQVCRTWNRVIADGMLWKKLIERTVRSDLLWQGLSERRGW